MKITLYFPWQALGIDNTGLSDEPHYNEDASIACFCAALAETLEGSEVFPEGTEFEVIAGSGRLHVKDCTAKQGFEIGRIFEALVQARTWLIEQAEVTPEFALFEQLGPLEWRSA